MVDIASAFISFLLQGEAIQAIWKLENSLFCIFKGICSLSLRNIKKAELNSSILGREKKIVQSYYLNMLLRNSSFYCQKLRWCKFLNCTLIFEWHWGKTSERKNLFYKIVYFCKSFLFISIYDIGSNVIKIIFGLKGSTGFKMIA